jgi:glycolate oxidase FAD binding subunit
MTGSAVPAPGGGEGSVRSARERLGGDTVDNRVWSDLREQRLPFFDAPAPLWRLSPNNSAWLDLPGRQLIDWGGAQRWLTSDARRSDSRAGGQGRRPCHRYTPGDDSTRRCRRR